MKQIITYLVLTVGVVCIPFCARPIPAPAHSQEIYLAQNTAPEQEKVPASKSEQDQQEELKNENSFVSWMIIGAGIVLLALVFIRISTSPSRDPSRTPR